jgi:hypothetical protein
LGTFTPQPPRRRKGEHGNLSAHHRNDSDWLLRAGALISTEARESKGQSWLVSRASNTNLSGARDAEEEAYERELARERELASRRGSRRGSLTGADEELRPPHSRYESRSHSRVGSRSQLKTPLRTPLRSPLERRAEGDYFSQEPAGEDQIPGPDFISLDEKLEAIERGPSQEDEALVRRLVKGDSTGANGWIDRLIGWSLFAVEENDEDSENDLTDAETDEGQLPHSASTRSFGAISDIHDEQMPPPKADEGGWQDAAWLLSVASKVLL